MMLKVSRRELVSVLLAAKNDEAKRKVIKDEFQFAIHKGYLKKPFEIVSDDYLTSVEGYEYYLKAYLISNMPLVYKTAGLYTSLKNINFELYEYIKDKLILRHKPPIQNNKNDVNLVKIDSDNLVDETIRLLIKLTNYFEFQLLHKIDKLPSNSLDTINLAVDARKSHLNKLTPKRRKMNHVPQNKVVSSSVKDVSLTSLNNNSELSFFSANWVAQSVPFSPVPVFTASHGIRRPNKIISKSKDSMEYPAFLNEIPAFKYIEVPGDGHCLFHAVGLYIGKDQQILRDDVASYMEKNLNEFQEFIDLSRNQTIQNYIQTVRAGEEWADHIEIEVLMRALKRPIIIVHPDKEVTNLERVKDFEGDPIFVYYKDRIHYDALLIKNQFTWKNALQQLNQLKASRNQTLLYNKI